MITNSHALINAQLDEKKRQLEGYTKAHQYSLTSASFSALAVGSALIAAAYVEPDSPLQNRLLGAAYATAAHIAYSACAGLYTYIKTRTLSQEVQEQEYNPSNSVYAIRHNP